MFGILFRKPIWTKIWAIVNPPLLRTIFVSQFGNCSKKVPQILWRYGILWQWRHFSSFPDARPPLRLRQRWGIAAAIVVSAAPTSLRATHGSTTNLSASTDWSIAVEYTKAVECYLRRPPDLTPMVQWNNGRSADWWRQKRAGNATACATSNGRSRSMEIFWLIRSKIARLFRFA